MGMTHTNESRVRFLGTALDSGIFGNDGSLSGMLHLFLISFASAVSQISRGSKDSTASIVSTTTAAKNNNPGPGSTDINGCNWMSDTVNVSTNTSTMDQRPMISTIR